MADGHNRYMDKQKKLEAAHSPPSEGDKAKEREKGTATH
jgi:hypothetical protein